MAANPFRPAAVDLSARMPTSKMDTTAAELIVSLGYPAVAPVLPHMLTWLQDRLNWPVARVFQPLLVSIGAPLAPHVRAILATDDEFWKYSMVVDVIAQSAPLAQAMRADLQRVATCPTPGETAEGLPREALDILSRLALQTGAAQ
jgi:Domain of unknown function (DUF5071)